MKTLPTLQFVFLFLTVQLVGCAPPGMRLLKMEVYQDKKLVLRTTFDAPDREGPAEFWRRAGAEPFAADQKVAALQPTKTNLLQARLTGPVEIRILHAKRVMTSAKLRDLELVRKAVGSQAWYLPTGEIARAKKAAGL